MKNSLACYLFLFIWISSFFAANSKAQNADSLFNIQQITINGLKRTHSYVILRELPFSSGQFVTQKQIEQGVQNLKNLHIFSAVQHHLNPLTTGYELIIDIGEKWTTIPVFTLFSGGETYHFITGAYDPNVFGRYIEMGVQYENYNQTHSGWFWFYNPRYRNKRVRTGFDVLSLRRTRALYTTTGYREARYVRHQKQLSIFIDKEFTPSFLYGGSLQTSYFDIEDMSISKIELSQIEPNISPQTNSKTFALSQYVRFGKLNYDIYLVKDWNLQFNFTRLQSQVNTNHGFNRFVAEAKYFSRVGQHINIGARIRTGATSSDKLQDLFFIGGLSQLRGYFDGQFRGKYYWHTNIETRITTIKHSWFVIQSILFFDSAQIAFSASQLGADGELFSSYGFGFRLISPKIYRFNGRIDFAHANSPSQSNAISFGAQQFF